MIYIIYDIYDMIHIYVKTAEGKTKSVVKSFKLNIFKPDTDSF